jgi:hypothetical protein
MTQKELVVEYLKENGTITPARMSGKIYKSTMFGSEVSRICRFLRADGILDSVREKRFEKFFLAEN